MKHSLIPVCLLLCSLLLSSGCSEEEIFASKNPDSTGVLFSNQVAPSVGFSILDYPYFYNGGGVAVADFDQDGLQDLYFTANQGENGLYRNLGNWQFEDLTTSSGAAGPTNEWATGVSVVDINADGLPDLYVCYLSGELGQTGINRLFVNQGNFQFTESAAEYGLDLKGMCTQAAFFDADRDGDLDCYLLKHSVRPAEVVRDTALRQQRDPWAGDQLLRNDDGYFVDISESAGISGSRLGYGLNVLVNDWTGDGWPDIYICNDFQEDDYFYVNQQNGTFSNELNRYFGHTSRFSMGGDFADLNEDGLADILTLDMKPDREDILKTAEAPESFDAYHYKLTFGYQHQFPRNALQVSHSNGSFSDVSQLAGVDATDWSWGALFGDLNLDGYQDLFITNGIYRRPNDMDYIKFLSEPGIKRELSGEPSQAHLRFIDKMPSIPLPNAVLIRDPDNMRFESREIELGIGHPRFSNGLAMADLDNDGDLDLIENNLNGPVGLMENRLVNPDSASYLKIRLHQEGMNPAGIGARLTVQSTSGTQSRVLAPVRGFMSSQPAMVHLGWPHSDPGITDIIITWPDGGRSRWTPANRIADTTLIIDRKDTEPLELDMTISVPEEILKIDPTYQGFIHREDDLVDFNREPLMPHMLSRLGPAGAVSEDRSLVFIGGAAGQPGLLIEHGVQHEIGGPEKRDDVAACFLDQDGDGQEELRVIRGGNMSGPDARVGVTFKKSESGIWEEVGSTGNGNGSCIVLLDIDHDGDTDVFEGGRVVPGSYGRSPVSTLWLNQEGILDHVQYLFDDQGNSFDSLGMISDAIALDWDGDGREELITVGEWESIRVWKFVDSQMIELFHSALAYSSGWWNHVNAMDIDGDGDQDLLVGNLGWNSDLQASAEEPCVMYLEDWDNNGQIDPIICRTEHGRHLTWASRDELLGQLSYLRRRYPSYASFAGETVEDIFGSERVATATTLNVQTFSSIWIENKGNGQWQRHELPWQAQAFPLFASILIENAPGGPAMLLGGNLFGVGPRRGRYDAGQGLLMRYQNGAWQILDDAVWGSSPRSVVRDFLRTGEREILVLRNNDSVIRLTW